MMMLKAVMSVSVATASAASGWTPCRVCKTPVIEGGDDGWYKTSLGDLLCFVCAKRRVDYKKHWSEEDAIAKLKKLNISVPKDPFLALVLLDFEQEQEQIRFYRQELDAMPGIKVAELAQKAKINVMKVIKKADRIEALIKTKFGAPTEAPAALKAKTSHHRRIDIRLAEASRGPPPIPSHLASTAAAVSGPPPFPGNSARRPPPPPLAATRPAGVGPPPPPPEALAVAQPHPWTPLNLDALERGYIKPSRQKVKVLGVGAFGSVDLVVEPDGSIYTRKIWKDAEEEINTEGALSEKLMHLQEEDSKRYDGQILNPDVFYTTRILDAPLTDQREDLGYHVKMEACLGGDLLHFALNTRDAQGLLLSDYEFILLLTQAFLGVNWMHHHGHLHADIKLNNFVLDHNGRVKICDFGQSYVQENSREPEEGEDEDITHCGRKSDIYQLGSTFQQLCEFNGGTGEEESNLDTLLSWMKNAETENRLTMEQFLEGRGRPVEDWAVDIFNWIDGVIADRSPDGTNGPVTNLPELINELRQEHPSNDVLKPADSVIHTYLDQKITEIEEMLES